MADEHWPWTRAGVRRDPAKRAEILARYRRRHEEAAEQRKHHLRVAHRKWRAGLVVPYNITLALNAKNLHGPEVDHACNAEEPEVDLWEAAKLYPRWDQLLALANLTAKTPRWFTETHEPLDIWETSMRFHIPLNQLHHLTARRAQAPLRYPDSVVAQCPGTDSYSEAYQ